MEPEGFILRDEARAAPFREAAAARDARFVWLHLDARDPESERWVREESGLPVAARNALLAAETRPRLAEIEDGVLVNLRGLGETPEDDPDPLVSVRIWAERGKIVSLDVNNPAALPAMREAMLAGRLRDPGDFIAAIADRITDGLDPDVAAMGDALDECEAGLDRSTGPTRGDIARIRSRAIGFRRFVAPQRDALTRIAQLGGDWLEEADRLHLREAADRCARMAEELDAMRERAALIQEQLTEMRSEQLERQTFLLSLVALIFLPLTFLTGLFGMNVALPWQEEPRAFSWLLILCAAFAGGLVTLFVLLRWLRR